LLTTKDYADSVIGYSMIYFSIIGFIEKRELSTVSSKINEGDALDMDGKNSEK
jgi:hypothetical protein